MNTQEQCLKITEKVAFNIGENAKIEKPKCDIFDDFQTLCDINFLRFFVNLKPLRKFGLKWDTNFKASYAFKLRNGVDGKMRQVTRN